MFGFYVDVWDGGKHCSVLTDDCRHRTPARGAVPLLSSSRLPITSLSNTSLPCQVQTRHKDKLQPVCRLRLWKRQEDRDAWHSFCLRHTHTPLQHPIISCFYGQCLTEQLLKTNGRWRGRGEREGKGKLRGGRRDTEWNNEEPKIEPKKNRAI